MLLIPMLLLYTHRFPFPSIIFRRGGGFTLLKRKHPNDFTLFFLSFSFFLSLFSGFLKPGLNEHTVSNFGLLDQIAGLQWIKDNIGEFGGDSSMVTLMGHGTGAACINFLMVSPVSMASEGKFL